jgi:16S rRNA (adenine1518-N6/adenine1519-N6)-dimethyltransferase
MRDILTRGDIQLTKSLGQNFLHDANQLRRIVEAADLQKSDKVLEIGPGLGPLTEVLVKEAGEVLAIEKDARLVEALRKRFQTGEGTALRLIHADALEYVRCEQRDWSDWKLVANLPYSIASPILVELAQKQRGPRRMVATLQIEVAKRLMAKPGGAEYGVLTLLIQLDYEPQKWFKIPASCFFPEPNVDSACVSLLRRDQPVLALEQRDLFVKIVKRSFSQRRKMMFKLLKEDWPVESLERAFETLRIPLQARAETVSCEQFVRLVQLLSSESKR